MNWYMQNVDDEIIIEALKLLRSMKYVGV